MEIKDYRQIPIPDPEEKSTEDFTADERRAWIYDDAVEHGGTRMLPNTYEEYAELFGISTSMVHKDVKHVRKAILKHGLSEESIREDIASTLRWATKKAREEDDVDAARRAADTLKIWAQDLGIEDKQPEKHEIEHSGGIADKLRSIYKDKKSGGGESSVE